VRRKVERLVRDQCGGEYFGWREGKVRVSKEVEFNMRWKADLDLELAAN
jgi:hypothetical protein